MARHQIARFREQQEEDAIHEGERLFPAECLAPPRRPVNALSAVMTPCWRSAHARCSEAAECSQRSSVSLSNDNAWVSDRNVAIDRGPALPAWSCPGSAVTRARLLE